jgi:hypothetical protein
VILDQYTPSSFLLLEAVRTRYRIAKFHYGRFYQDHVQETLAGCLYNEGPRKSKKVAEQQDQLRSDEENIHPNSSIDE